MVVKLPEAIVRRMVDESLYVLVRAALYRYSAFGLDSRKLRTSLRRYREPRRERQSKAKETRAMAVSVQIVSRAASEKLSMKYCDLSSPSIENDEGPEPRRLSLQAFLLSNYANSPRRRLSVDDICDNHQSTFEGHRRSTESNEDAFILSRFGTVPFQMENSSPAVIKKTRCIGNMARYKTFQALSSKYKLLYLCGVSNIDMVDNYVTLQR